MPAGRAGRRAAADGAVFHCHGKGRKARRQGGSGFNQNDDFSANFLPWHMKCKIEGMPFGPVFSLSQETMAHPQEERRRFPRLRVSLPLTFRLEHTPAGETFQGRGVLRDLSLNGAYFFTGTPFSQASDLIVELSILCHVPGLDQAHTECLYARGKVVRLENHHGSRNSLGIAVSFLEGLSFFSPFASQKMFK